MWWKGGTSARGRLGELEKENYYLFDEKKDSLKNKERSVGIIYSKYMKLFDGDKSIRDKLEKEYNKL
ncbi:hypothetical protein QA601_16245 [Chitinispirillales bacterium ANBcel5]|uniref:hypothetical protein n=1 Tax=Cellulosispirillum alkaliphilum TaxID=3039283 RepID=UPI002A577AE3|nr:hypothetical protein [Chitinispirillales bacterium ANBcel5]